MLTIARDFHEGVVGAFSEDFRERLANRLLVLQIEQAIADGRMPPIGGAANGFYVTNAEAISMLTDYGVGIDAGTAAVIQVYSGSVPADADASNAGTLLATLTCSGTAFSGVADNTGSARATFAAITDDSSADATGTQTFFRISTQSAGTVVAQGTSGTSGTDLNFSATITAGAVVSITAATIDLPEGP